MHAHREVVDGVAVEVARDHRPAVLIARLRIVEDPRAALVPELGTIPGQPSGRTEDDRHRACVASPDVLVARTDRQVGHPVAVEVAGGQRPAEVVQSLRRVRDARSVLGEHLVVAGLQPRRRSVEDMDSTRPDAACLLERSTDGEVGEPVAVEVGLGRARRHARSTVDRHGREHAGRPCQRTDVRQPSRSTHRDISLSSSGGMGSRSAMIGPLASGGLPIRELHVYPET